MPGSDNVSDFKMRRSEDGRIYYDTRKLPSGQTIKIEFQEDRSYDKRDKLYYNVYLVTCHKRKQEVTVTLKGTGKDGLKGLLWAKQKVTEFEEHVREEGLTPAIIYCCWEDNRRRKVYERGLKPLGYRYSNLFGCKVLSKTVKAV